MVIWKNAKCYPPLKLLVNILECGFFYFNGFGSSQFKGESGSGNLAVDNNSERINSRRYGLIPGEALRLAGTHRIAVSLLFSFPQYKPLNFLANIQSLCY